MPSAPEAHLDAPVEQTIRALGIPARFDAPLAPLTWYGLGGPARVLARPQNDAQLAALVAACHDAGVPLYVLGSGANLLVSDAGVDGVVVRLDAPAFAQVKVEGSRVIAGAGFDLMKLVMLAARAGLGGLESLAGIPASVGGAVRMNAGGAFGAIGPSVERVRVMAERGQVLERHRNELAFTYRHSNIPEPFILEVEFALTPGDAAQLTARVKDIFDYKKRSQPMAANSPGCAFKNPGEGSAGRLIDQAGLKGQRIGGAEVSDRHANFLIAHPGCTAADILALMDHVQATVRDRFGVELQREVVVWP